MSSCEALTHLSPAQSLQTVLAIITFKKYKRTTSVFASFTRKQKTVRSCQCPVWPPFGSYSVTHQLGRVDQVIDCGLWKIGPLLLWEHAKLLDICENWNMLSYSIQSVPNMFNRRHVCSEHRPRNNWHVFSFQELYTDQWWQWMNGQTMGLKISLYIIISLHIQVAVNEMHLCLRCVLYSCLCHNPTTTISHSSYNMFSYCHPFSLLIFQSVG